MKTKKGVNLFRGLTVSFGAVLTLLVGASYGAFINEADINENLGTTSRQFVKADAATARFKSDYTDWKAMTTAKHENIKSTAGEGIGIDRLCMLFTNAASIRDVILFPLLKPHVEAK